MIGYRFGEYTAPAKNKKADFESLLKIFLSLLTMTSGDVGETMRYMNALDRQYGLTDDNYGMGDFYEDLKKKGYIEEVPQTGEVKVAARSEQEMRRQALDEIFGKLKKSSEGSHQTRFNSPQGDELTADARPYTFGDDTSQLSMTDTIRNAHINHGLDDFRLTEDDLTVVEREYRTQTSTVLMIDISHSMILYGEDRITPAKKVAMALAELITTRYPKDTLDIIVFGNDSWQIQIKDLPYLEVGPYHTNTVAGLELAMDILRRRKNKNKQIFMITDGKPTCIKEGLKYYKNSFGIDSKILRKTLTLAAQCRRLEIPVTTFMIASDPYLQAFVREFTEVNNGSAYYSSLKGLGQMVFEDYKRHKRRRF